MSRTRRQIKSNTCYEVCFRARESLPLSVHRVIRLLIRSYLARTQRDDKVTLCHDIWNGSHPHLITIARDVQQCANFYAELQKKITDAIKRLLGLKYLRIWEGRATVIELADIDAAKDRIAYLYSNPAQDNLEVSIERFPGYSSWLQYQKCQAKLTDKVEESVPWIRLPSIPKIDSVYLTEEEDERLVRLLLARNKKKHRIVRSPNAWMKCFGVTADEDVQQINTEIMTDIRSREEKEAERRSAEGKTVLGRARLIAQPIMKDHTPKKNERKIFVISTVKELRIQIIKARREFENLCRYCYERWLQGDFGVEWPPGAFKPPLRPAYNVLPEWD